MSAEIKASLSPAAPPPSSGAAGACRPHVIIPKLHATSRRQALQLMIEAAHEATLLEGAPFDARLALDAALMRERLSGTGVGEGVAIPHARIGGLASPFLVFARLDPAVDFGAMDALPADLVLLLLTPADNGADHLKALAGASRLLRRPGIREKLRAARGVEGVLAVFEASQAQDAG
jgi:PTS system nitrogen regulatory IIA component